MGLDDHGGGPVCYAVSRRGVEGEGGKEGRREGMFLGCLGQIRVLSSEGLQRSST